MFLDEKLYTHTKSKEIKSPQDFSDLVNELYRICEDHYKPELTNDRKVIKATIDRTFRSWDIFIQKLQKEDWFLIDFLGKNEYSYKKVFFDNQELNRVYKTL